MSTKISTILDRIDNGSLALPVFQRGYVWNREQVRELFNSLYRGYPVGSLLIWETSSTEVKKRGDLPIPINPLQLLLDGQQRMTSLYGVMRGRKPDFFDGKVATFTGLHFHLEDQVFEFYQPVKMQSDPLWINVSRLYENDTQGIQPIIQALDEEGVESSEYMGRLLTLLGIKNRVLHVDLVTGNDKTTDVVVNIFNRVNSGGTKLTHGDLALAKICAEWPEAREVMQSKLLKWKQNGYEFNLDWLLRIINAIVINKARFTHLHDVQHERIQDGLNKAEVYIDKILNMISNRIGLDHSQVLFAKPAIAIISAFLDKNDGKITPAQRDKLLYWYIHAGMWRRYSGSPDTTLEKDLSILQNAKSPNDCIDRLIEEVRLSRGGLQVEAQHFHGATRRVRFYSVLYMLTRMGQAKDFGDGLPLRKHQLGRMAQLELHHIFPKAKLKKAGYEYKAINALANFCFVTKETNLKLGTKLPTDYFPKAERDNPGVLASQWIPMDSRLWNIDKYEKFLEARKQMLADATNQALDGLLSDHDELPEDVCDIPIDPNMKVPIRPASIADDEEEALINEINEWAQDKGLAAGIIGYELVDPITGEQLAMFDLAWPEGVQSELSEPVAILIDEDRDVLVAANKHGYRFFVNQEDFQSYINDEILSDHLDRRLDGENETTEYKSTLRINLHTGEKDPRLEHSVLKTLAGFLNRDGGILLIGVSDDGTPIGIKADKFKSEDKMSLHLVNLVKSRMGPVAIVNMRLSFETHQDNRVMKVVCKPAPAPVYVKDGNTERFFVRMGPSTEELLVSHIPGFIRHRFNQ